MNVVNHGLRNKAIRSARRFLAARDLNDTWREALDAGVKLSLNNEARLVIGARIRLAGERACGELYRDLSRLGEPVEAGGRRVAIDTETTTIVVEPAGEPEEGEQGCWS